MKEFSQRYLEILRTHFSHLNLTRILEEEAFYQKQILDSLLPLHEFKDFKERAQRVGLFVDVGFGGGFPILPLAKVLPRARFLGLDARNKKVEAVRQIAAQLSLPNVRLFHGRIEKILLDRECILTFKAVGSVAECLDKIRVCVPLWALFYKGPLFYEQEGRDRLPPGWVLEEELKVELPMEGRRILLLYGFRPPKVQGKFPKKGLANLSQIVEQFFG